MYLLKFLLLSAMVCAPAEADYFTNQIPKEKLTARERYQALVFTTPAYKREALRELIEEANHIARQLKLPENLPISETNLVESYVSPPRLATGLKAIGIVATSNYVYAPYSGGHFSVVRAHLREEYANLQKHYLMPATSVDTNSAYHLAVTFLRAGGYPEFS